MPILKRTPGSNFMVLSEMATKLAIKTFDSGLNTSLPSNIFVKCEKAMPVFGDLTDTDLLKNDFTSVIRSEWLGENITFWLLDENCEKIAELDNSNTYGTYFPRGFVPTSTPGSLVGQESYKGYKIEWAKVLALHGAGLYKISVETDSWMKFKEFCSCNFELNHYSEEMADETVRVTLTHNGKTLSQNIDFRFFNWDQQYRFYGFFGNKQRRLEQDDYLDSKRRTTQIQDTLVHEYTMTTYLVPSCMASMLDEMLLANNVVVDDYNVLNNEQHLGVDVKPIGVDSEYFAKSKDVSHEIKFEDRYKKHVKRNVR